MFDKIIIVICAIGLPISALFLFAGLMDKDFCKATYFLMTIIIMIFGIVRVPGRN